MYETALNAHSILRLAVVLIGLYAFQRALRGWLGGRQVSAGDKFSGVLFMIVVDVQFAIGILLHTLWSPQTKAAMQDMGAAMKDPTLRYWAVEHGTMMLLAVIVVHVGARMARASKHDRARFRRTALAFGIALAMFVAGSPWPWSAQARPILHFLG